MSGKLDQALGDIINNTRAGKGRPGARPRRRLVKDRAPVGGVTKTKPAKKNDKTPTGPALKGESKVQVSKLVRASNTLQQSINIHSPKM